MQDTQQAGAPRCAPRGELPTRDMLLTVADVAELLCVTARTVIRWSQKGRLPRPIKLSPRAVRWLSSQIQAHIDRLSALERAQDQLLRVFHGQDVESFERAQRVLQEADA